MKVKFYLVEGGGLMATTTYYGILKRSAKVQKEVIDGKYYFGRGIAVLERG